MRSLVSTQGSRTSTSRIAARTAGVGKRAAREATAHKRREEQALLESLRAEADDAARARPALLSLLSHDLRNPLSVVLVSLRMLARGLGEEHAARRHTDAIARAADEMSGILQDMSDVARIEEGRLTLTLTREDAGAMLTRAADAARRAADAKDVTIRASIGDAAIACDRDRVQRLLQSLVASAVRLTPRGGAVAITSAPTGNGSVRISIADGGHGLPKDMGDRAFDLPCGGAGSHGRLPVAGLALYAARGVVEAHGGAIELERAHAGNSSFVLTLPLASPEG